MIRHVPVPARRLLTLREDHPIWTPRCACNTTPCDCPTCGPYGCHACRGVIVDGLLYAGREGVSVAGALVRLHPPAGISEQDVAVVVACLERSGAARVKVVPRSSAPEVVRRIDVDPPPTPKLSHREVVLAATAEARSSDPAALRALLEGILDEEGL